MKTKDGYCVVLAGGGARGSYQYGAWKALRKLKVPMSAFIGTSVGSLNATFMAQNSFDDATEVWETVNLDSIVDIPPEMIKEGRVHIGRDNIARLKEINRSFFKNLGLDTQPLLKLIRRKTDERLLRKTGIDLGLLTYNMSDFKPLEAFLEDIPRGRLPEYLLASCTLPFFKPTKIGKKKMADGGFHRNLPYEMARARGYRKLLILDISVPALGLFNNVDTRDSSTVYIRNSIEIGGLLDFNKGVLDRTVELGYLDTMRVFGSLQGQWYFYSTEKKTLARLHDAFIQGETQRNIAGLLAKTKGDSVKEKIREVLPKEMKLWRHPELALMECAAKSLGIEQVQQYRLKELLLLIETKYRALKRADPAEDDHIKQVMTSASPASKDLKEKNPLEYELALSRLLGKLKISLTHKALHTIFPILPPAHAFFFVLEQFIKASPEDDLTQLQEQLKQQIISGELHS